MTASELRDRIKLLVKQVYKDKAKTDDAALAYDELVKFYWLSFFQKFIY